MTDENPDSRSDRDTDAVDFEAACQFIRDVGREAHRYGSTTVRLQSYLRHLTEALGYHGVFLVTPTEMLLAFQEDAETPQRFYLEKLPPTDYELNRLSNLGQLITEVKARRLSLAEARVSLEGISKTPHPWGALALGACFTVAGAGFSLMMSGGPTDVLFAAVLSLLVFVLQPLIGRFAGALAGDWSLLLTALAVGAAAAGTKIALPELNLLIVTVSALIMLIPGFIISAGIVEIANSHVVSGFANLMNGLLQLTKLFLGAWLGVSLVAFVHVLPQAPPGAAVDSVWLFAALPVLLAALCCAFQTAPRNFLVVSAIGASSVLGMVGGGALLGANWGTLIGTILPVCLSNSWSNRTGSPSSIALLPSMMLVVSGSIGFQGLAELSLGQVALGQQKFLQMFIVAFTIGAGLLVGNTIVRPEPGL
jgi:uncharacterized membrane protein YjjP (DUF1212 family)